MSLLKPRPLAGVTAPPLQFSREFADAGDRPRARGLDQEGGVGGASRHRAPGPAPRGQGRSQGPGHPGLSLAGGGGMQMSAASLPEALTKPG